MSVLERTIKDIKTMRIRGANAIAIAGLEAVKDVVKKEGFGRKFNRACGLLIKARPTAVPLYNAIGIAKGEKRIESIERMIFYLENIGDVIGFVNFKMIKNNSTILTHCHSRDVIDFLKVAKEKGKKFNVIVTETRPLYQGIKTAKELSELDIPVTYIIDSAAGFFMSKVDMVVVGADAIRGYPENCVINKIGTYPIAVLAKINKKSFYIIANTLKIDRRKKVIIEERDSSEVIKKLRRIKVCNPAFDKTPFKYISRIICERGVLKPQKFIKEAKKSALFR